MILDKARNVCATDPELRLTHSSASLPLLSSSAEDLQCNGCDAEATALRGVRQFRRSEAGVSSGRARGVKHCSYGGVPRFSMAPINMRNRSCVNHTCPSNMEIMIRDFRARYLPFDTVATGGEKSSARSER